MIRSLLDANDFRTLTQAEHETFTALRETENNIVVAGIDLKTLGVPAPFLSRIIGDVYSPEVANSFNVMVMSKRLGEMSPSVHYSPFVLLFFATSADRVGVAVMWSYTMLDYFRRTGNILTLDLLHDWFKGRLPTEDSMHRLWDEQKVATIHQSMSDNQIDNPMEWRV
jgi:hypothetical protein